MCGIFGVVSNEKLDLKDIEYLARHSEQRGKDSSGLLIGNTMGYDLHRSNERVSGLLKHVTTSIDRFIMGHSRLVTNGLTDNQPVYREGVCVIHNGIVVNHDALWDQLNKTPLQVIDTEIIAAITANHLERGGGGGRYC